MSTETITVRPAALDPRSLAIVFFARCHDRDNSLDSLTEARWEVAVGSTVAAAGACRSRVVRIHLRSHALVAPGLALPGHGVAKNVPTVKPSSGLVEHPSKCLFYPCEDRCLCDNFGRENVGLYKNTAKQHRRGV